MDPNIKNSYGDSTLGYGKLTKDQSDKVDANKTNIDKAKEVVSTSIANVAGVKAGSPMLQSRVNQFAPSVRESLNNLASQGTLTDPQKEILKNAETNIQKIKIEAKGIHEELNILAKKAAKAESEMSAKYEKLDESSQKVESFKGKRDFGQANPLLGTKKTDRVEDSGKREMEATGKASVAFVDAQVLIGKQDNLSTKIADLGVKKTTFETQLEVRFNLAKDIHTKIKDAEKEYEGLGAKYEAQKDAFFNFKNPAKMKDEDKEAIKNKMAEIKEGIKELKNLEEDIGKRKIGENEEDFIKNTQKQISENIDSIKSKVTGVKKDIESTISEKMGIRDRIKHAIVNTFSFGSKISEIDYADKEKTFTADLATSPTPPQSLGAKSSLESLNQNISKLENPSFFKLAKHFFFKNEKAIDDISNKLADLYINPSSTPEMRTQIKVMNDRLKLLAGEGTPLSKSINLRQKVAMGLVESLTKNYLKNTFEETVSNICREAGLSKSDIIKEARLLGVDNKTAELKMVNRLIVYGKGMVDAAVSPSLAKRVETTGYELSTIKQIEKAFKHFVVNSKESEIIYIDKNISVIPVKGGIIVEEKYLNAGAFKVAVLASDYFEMKTPDDRGQFVSLKPKISKATEEATSEPKVEAAVISEPEEESVYGGTMQIGDMDDVDFNPEEDDQELPPNAYEMPLKELKLSHMEMMLKELENKNDQPLKNETLTKISDLKEAIAIRQEEKIAFKNYKNMKDFENYEHDIKIALDLQGENVIKMHKVIDLKSGDKVMIQEAAGYSFGRAEFESSEGTKSLVLDLDNIRDIRHERRISQAEKFQMLEILTGGLRGVERMHDLGYIHRDLKESNILVTKEGKGVLSDFGTVVKEEGDLEKVAYFGTPAYSAPETFRYGFTEQWNNLNKASDVWSVGMILHNLFVGDMYEHPSLKDIDDAEENPEKISSINSKLHLKKEQYEKSYPEPAAEKVLDHLIWSCTRIDPEQRPKMKEVNEKLEFLLGEWRSYRDVGVEFGGPPVDLPPSLPPQPLS